MDIQYFFTFREVARCQSLTKAGERLGYAQPTISVQMQKLETHFGTKLFLRTGNKLKLTDEGTKLLNYADQMVEAYLNAIDHISKQKEINIAIGTTETLAAFYLPPIFQTFRDIYPNANVKFFPASNSEIIRQVKSDEIDLGIVLESQLSDPELNITTIRQEELIIISPKEHALSGKKRATVQDLNNNSFILTEKGCTYRAALERTMEENKISYQVVSEMGSMEGIKQCVVYGIGIAFVPRIAAVEHLEKNLICGIPVHEGLIEPFFTQLLLHKNKHVSPPLQNLINLLVQNHATALKA
ncbi:LysR family transcriptional regulator [Paenibacillus filicis]|uniref:LysR family transcriptional regulator n=1 Tax=Paenibacillus filicis TaxID=669464 RepID=A0ABU9DG69_9BACL